MHYRNGREAKNGDIMVSLNERGQIVGFGVLHSATSGNDFCNGAVAQIHNQSACLADALHVDDVAELLRAAQLEKRRTSPPPERGPDPFRCSAYRWV